MSILWILLWAVLSLIILGATFWNIIILQKQKKVWAEFADKKGLMFQKGSFSSSCAMDGVIDGYQVSFFTAEQQNPDVRKRRKVTGMQINVTEGIVDSMAAATVEMLPFVKSLPGILAHKPQSKKWDKNHHLFVRNPEAVDAYLTDERADAVKKLLNMKNADVVLLIDDGEAVLRYETTNPMNDLALLEKVVKATLGRIDVLKVTKKERKALAKIVKELQEQDDEDDDDEEDSATAEPVAVEKADTSDEKAVEKSNDKKTSKKSSDKAVDKKKDN